MMMQHAFDDGAPMNDKTLAPLEEIRLVLDEVWIAAPLNREGDETRTVNSGKGEAVRVTVTLTTT